jgi:predicted nucleic-acid-binding protein
VRVCVDTNILVRAVVRDDAVQAVLAATLLRDAALVAITLPTLCELVWVLRQSYGLPCTEIAATIRRLMGAANVEMNRPAVELGLSMLDAGGDFADGAIAYEGEWQGADLFMSFDRKAVALLVRHGQTARVCS